MKKFIALTTLSLCFALTSLNANADDTKRDMTGSDTSAMQPGTTDTTRTETMKSKGTTTGMHDTCTDEGGVTYKKGQKGFNECMKTMSKKKPEGMGGEARSSTTTTTRENSEDSNQ